MSFVDINELNLFSAFEIDDILFKVGYLKL